MPLQVGARLGPYEILSPLGAGGMGEVYRARDTKLGRDVAIKVLPDGVATDPERLARFHREAQVLASLNHPNIAHIHGYEASGDVHALVMELVEGPTLADRIAQGPIALAEALPIAKQIAEALEAAHEQGIIHRDLKPANVKVREDGAVKVLDFGLAKAMEPTSGSGPSASMSPTITTPAMTQAGMILGTAAYMSPEQARGRPVDRRADIWALGVVLYEMISGRRAFDGDDVSIIMAGVLKSEPDWTALPADLPTGLRKLLRRCLEKDPRQRLQSIGDARLELSDIAAGQSEPSAAAAVPQEVTPPSLTRALPWTLALASFAGLVVVAFMHFREPPAVAAPELRTEVVTPSTLDPTAFALSPDGTQMVFLTSVNGPARLWLRPLSASAAKPLPGTEGAASPFWSPDSRAIGFFADGKLKRLTIGGAVQVVSVTGGGVARGGSWNAEGMILFVRNTRSGIFRVPSSGGEPVAVTKPELGSGHRFPYFLPDGRHFLYSVLGAPTIQGIYLGTLDGAESARLVTVGAGDTGAVYVPSGWMLWVRSGTLVAQRLDVEKRTMSGDPVTIAEQVAYDAGTQAGALAVSATGLISYRLGGASRRQLRWFDRAGKALATFGAPDEGLFAPRLSPDGRRAAVYRNFQNTLDIWLMDETRLSRLTFDAVQHRFPIWSPDGSQVAFDGVRKQSRDLYVASPARPGGDSLLLESQEDKFANDWSADGRFLLYTSASLKTNTDMWVLPLNGERKPWPFLQTPAGEKLGQFSPDGRWIAYMSNESGMNEVYVRPFVPSPSANASGAGERWQISSGGGMHPKWRADGKELFFVDPEGQMMGAPMASNGNAIEPGKPVVLFQTRIYGGGVDNGQGWQYDVARDGRFLINTVLDEGASAITLLQNWKAK